MIEAWNRKRCGVLFFPPVKGLAGSLFDLEKGTAAVKGVIMPAPLEGCSDSGKGILICPYSLQYH